MFDTVSIILDGEEVVLTPSVGAMETLSDKYGTFQKVLDGLAGLDYNLYVNIISAGVLPKKADVKNTKRAVFEAGIIDLLPKLTEFVILLMNGGKKPVEEETEERPLTNS